MYVCMEDNINVYSMYAYCTALYTYENIATFKLRTMISFHSFIPRFGGRTASRYSIKSRTMRRFNTRLPFTADTNDNRSVCRINSLRSTFGLQHI